MSFGICEGLLLTIDPAELNAWFPCTESGDKSPKARANALAWTGSSVGGIIFPVLITNVHLTIAGSNVSNTHFIMGAFVTISCGLAATVFKKSPLTRVREEKLNQMTGK